MFKIAQKNELNQVSLTGMRALLLVGLLIQAPRTLEEIREVTASSGFDILITIDTSIAHLAGAMGIRTYLMLPYDSEWRWFYNEKSTEWYNSIKIFRENFQIGARRITVSTCGIIPQIEKLAQLDFQSTLAISLHASDNEKRKQIMPVSNKYPYDKLIDALKMYTEKTGRRVTIEYVLIKDINDTLEDAKKLAYSIAKLKSNVNLIIYNQNEYSQYKKPLKENVMKFKYILEASGKKVTIRLERGGDIDAACGQLSSKMKNK